MSQLPTNKTQSAKPGLFQRLSTYFNAPKADENASNNPTKSKTSFTDSMDSMDNIELGLPTPNSQKKLLNQDGQAIEIQNLGPKRDNNSHSNPESNNSNNDNNNNNSAWSSNTFYSKVKQITESMSDVTLGSSSTITKSSMTNVTTSGNKQNIKKGTGNITPIVNENVHLIAFGFDQVLTSKPATNKRDLADPKVYLFVCLFVCLFFE